MRQIFQTTDTKLNRQVVLKMFPVLIFSKGQR